MVSVAYAGKCKHCDQNIVWMTAAQGWVHSGGYYKQCYSTTKAEPVVQPKFLNQDAH